MLSWEAVVSTQSTGASIIKNLSINDLQTFRDTQYRGCSIVISTVGNVKHDEVLEAATRSFSSLQTGENVSRYSRVPFTGSQMNIRDDTVHEVQLAIAYETFPYTNEHVLTLAIIKEMLGSWQKNSNYGNNASSRLAETLANTNLAHEFKVFNQHTQNTGLFGLYARTHDEDSLDDLVYQLFNEFQKLNAYITVDELFRAQNLLKGKLLRTFDSTEASSRIIGRNVLLLQRHPPLVEIFDRIDQIRVKDVQEVLGTYFFDVDPVVVAHGPLDEMVEYSIVRSWSQWNRW
eukprot:TRINITY_DN3407_c0_g1_i6.p1 TRINITY_DN3407_c0_g1~~TRINITY_DN3407_c0_g1_i6.p1  ORF type:complete len:289 (+),score=55.61 TRINITY_DN3407_c0_g1_i6:53-919(+)